jgi:hypothetical protein
MTTNSTKYTSVEVVSDDDIDYMESVYFAKKRILKRGSVAPIEILNQENFYNVIARMSVREIDNEFLQYVDEAIYGSYGKYFRHAYYFPKQGDHIEGLGIVAHTFTFTFEIVEIHIKKTKAMIDKDEVKHVCDFITKHHLTPSSLTEAIIRREFPSIKFTIEFMQVADKKLVGDFGYSFCCVYGYVPIDTKLNDGKYMNSKFFFTCETLDAEYYFE